MDRYGWTNRQTHRLEGQMDGLDGRTGRQIYRLADGWTDRWTHGMERHGRNKRTDDGLIDKRLKSDRIDRSTELTDIWTGWTYGWTDGKTDISTGLTDRLNGQTDKRIDGRAHGWTDRDIPTGRTDGWSAHIQTLP